VIIVPMVFLSPARQIQGYYL